MLKDKGHQRGGKIRLGCGEDVVMLKFFHLFFFYLFHEALAQTNYLGKEDRVVGEVRAQIAEHAERVPA